MLYKGPNVKADANGWHLAVLGKQRENSEDTVSLDRRARRLKG